MCFFYFGIKFRTHFLVIFCEKLLENCIQVIDTSKFAVYRIGWVYQVCGWYLQHCCSQARIKEKSWVEVASTWECRNSQWLGSLLSPLLCAELILGRLFCVWAILSSTCAGGWIPIAQTLWLARRMGKKNYSREACTMHIMVKRSGTSDNKAPHQAFIITSLMTWSKAPI